MFGIFVHANGLKFTGKIASSKEIAEKYLSNMYGREQMVSTGKRDKNGYFIYIKQFVPGYNEDAFVIKELEVLG